jgi:hypothetical protein
MGGNGRRGISFRSSSIGSRLNTYYTRLPTSAAPGGGPNGGGSGGAKAAAAAAERRRDLLRRSAYAALVALPWLVLALLLLSHAYRGGRRQLTPPLADLPGAKQCVGWRETIFCHPFT